MHALMGPPRPLLDAFRHAYPGYSPDVFVRAPGCINLLGEHVDNHDGIVLNVAINREIWLAAAYGSADLVRVYTPDLDASTALLLKRLDERVDVVGDDLPRWAYYPAGIAWALQKRGMRVNGINVAFLGSVLMRAGLSSAAAVEMAFAIAWQALESWRLDPGDLVQVGHTAERDYMGVSSGIQAQFTCLNAREGHALWLDCRTLENGHMLLPPPARIVVCEPSTRRELVSSHSNGRAQDGHDTARTIGLMDREVTTLRDVSLDRLKDFESVLTENQFRRSRHVVTEIARVRQGIKALEVGDLEHVGELMNQSYWSARDDYGNSSDALDAMWQAATAHPGCYGARYSGSGEAGAVVALVDADAVDDFVAQTAAQYEQSTGQQGCLFAVELVRGAGILL
ncbi:MAG: hypothetical protein JW966_04375 [Anaerolineae bacterium]|nr:hypothetical protein [Anaerolineae bacterium]